MTELEQLKQNTEIELMKQRSAELDAHIIKLIKQADEARYWQLRGVKLYLFCLTMYMVTTTVIAFSGLEYALMDTQLDWMFIVLTWSILRTMVFTARVGHVEGQLIGVLETLRILGMVKVEDDDEDGARKTKKRKSLFPRFKEFFERVGQTEQKEVPQAT